MIVWYNRVTKELRTIEKINTNIFDEEEIYTDCTVRILRNSITGEIDIGWWQNDKPPKILREENTDYD